MLKVVLYNLGPLLLLPNIFLAIGSGLQIGWPSPSFLKLLSKDLDFEINEEQASYIVSIAPLGYLIGSPLSGFLLDRIGRKNTLLVLVVPQIFAWLLIVNSVNVPMLYIARILTGVADGGIFTSLPIYLCEVLEPKIRGFISTGHTVGIVMGILLVNCYGSYVSVRMAALISISVPLIYFLSGIFMPESPYYHVIKGDTEKAREALKKLRRKIDVDGELANITLDVQRQLSEPGKLKDLFTIKSNLKAFFIIFGLRTFQHFSGLTALTMYSQVIFQHADGRLLPAESSIICYGIQLALTSVGAVLVDRNGRKPLLIWSSILSAISLIIIGMSFLLQKLGYTETFLTWIPIGGMITYFVVNAIGLLMIPNIMTGELLSASVKSKGLGIINIYFGICTGATAKLFQWLDHDYGTHVPFFVFGVCCILSVIFCYYCVPETKGKTLEEIQQDLKNVDDNNKKTKNTQM